MYYVRSGWRVEEQMYSKLLQLPCHLPPYYLLLYLLFSCDYITLTAITDTVYIYGIVCCAAKTPLSNEENLDHSHRASILYYQPIANKRE